MLNLFNRLLRIELLFLVLLAGCGVVFAATAFGTTSPEDLQRQIEEQREQQEELRQQRQHRRELRNQRQQQWRQDYEQRRQRIRQQQEELRETLNIRNN